MTTYRLLRNNRESGPFSLEQLTNMGLKAYDLVWIDGKSAAWRYPSEVPELAAFAPAVEEQPFDRFFRRDKSAARPVTKPRFRIKADWRKLEDAISAPTTAPVEPPVTVRSEPVVGQTVAPVTPSPALPTAVAVKPMAPDDKTVPQTKYSESLDTIKERYTQTVLQRGRSVTKSGFARYALIIGLFPVLAAGIWIGSSWSNRNKLETVQTGPLPASPHQDTTVPATPAIADTPADEAPATETETVAPQMLTIKNNESAAVIDKPTATITANKVKNPVQTASQAVIKTLPAAAPTGKNKYARSISSPSGSAPVKNAVLNTQAPPAKSQTAPVTVLPAPSQAYEPVTTSGKNKINDYVSVKDEYEQVDDNNRQMKLHVHNKSNIPVDLVVLDLQYYDANGRFKKGETLYVNNLSAHDEVSLSAPAARNNQRIDYKVSLLSIEKKGIYLIAE